MGKKGSGLGQGLDALFADNTGEMNVKKTLRTTEIEPNLGQPRKSFSESALLPLAESIRDHGMLQPIIVRQLKNGEYQIVAGERRWRAACLIGLREVPVIIRDFDDSECMQAALIENLQREDLNPIEEALGFKELMETYDMTQDAVSKVAGCSRSAVANTVRLLNLPAEVQTLIKNGQVSSGHAKALLAVSDSEETLIELAKRVADDRLTVRALEKLIAELKKPARPIPQRDMYFREMEISLKEKIGRKVKVNYTGNKGSLTLEFYDKDDLKSLVSQLFEG